MSMDGSTIYEGTGEQFHLLPFSEQFLVWSARMWVEGLKNGEENTLKWTEAFVRAGVADAAHVFDRLMWVLAAGASSTIDVRCVSCAQVSPDEQRLLAVLAARQGFSGGDDPDELMSDILTPTGLRFFKEHAGALAQALAEAGMYLRPRAARPMSESHADGPPDIATQTIH